MFQEEHKNIVNFLKRTVFSVLFFCALPSMVLAVDNAQFVSQTVPSSMIAGQTYSVTIKMKNTGSTFAYWDYSTHKLGSQNPQNNTVWGTSRVLLTPNEFVGSNKTKIFVFQVTAPAQAGVYNFQWRMVKESGGTVQWFGDSTPNVSVTVLSQYAAEFISQSVPAKMEASSSYNVSVTFKNTGSAAWTKTGNFRLGSQNPLNNTYWHTNGRVELADGESVSVGQNKVFNFLVSAPTQPGVYNFQWRMLKEAASQEWFGDTSPNVPVEVLSKYSAAFVSQNVPLTMAAGGMYDVSVTMQNNGYTTWTKADSFILGSQSPQDNTIWSVARVYLNDSDSISTGNNKIFNLQVKAPASPGDYSFQWRMLKENVAWFGDYSGLLNISVSANNTPAVGTVSPLNGASNSGSKVIFTATYSDNDGWQNIRYADLLFNTIVSGANCVQVRYDQNANKLYLRNDNNSAWLGGFAPGTDNIIENSYGSLNCSGTTVSGTGNTFVVKWSITFKPSFQGTKYVFPHVQDDGGMATGWANKGTWRINFPPAVGTINPSSGNSNPNQAAKFTATYIDTDGWQDLSYVLILMNTGISGYDCLYARYNVNDNKLYLRNNEHTAWIGGFAPGSNNVIENSYVKLNCSSVTVSGSADTLTVNWSLTFKPAFAGPKKAYLYAVDRSNAYNGWVQKGSWTITNTAPSVGTITPSQGSSVTGVSQNFATTYSDPDTWLNIQYVHLLINAAGAGYTNCLYTYYNQNTNKLYLRNDAATAWVGGFAPGSSNVIENSSAKLDCSQTSVSGSGNTLTVNWAVTFKPGFNGEKSSYLYVKDDAGVANGWVQKGTWKVIEESKERIYIYLNGQRMSMEENGKKTFYHNDHLGGTNVVTDESGQQVKYLEYQPFGDTKIEEGDLKTKRKFTGKELDESTGLYDYAARQYDAKLGRFITADTVEPDLSNPQSLNRYSYCLNNPLKYVDPTGHWAQLLYYYAIIVVSSPDFQYDMQQLTMDAQAGDTFGMAIDAVSAAIPGLSATAAQAGRRTVSRAVDAIRGAKAVDRAADVGRTAEKGSGIIRVRHNTMVKNRQLIEKDEIIKASAKDGYVYVEKAKPKITEGIVKGSPVEKAKELGIKPWQKGNAGVDFDIRANDLETAVNPVTKGTDLRIKGDVDLKNRNPEYFRRKE